jgi:hypothetical protein
VGVQMEGTRSGEAGRTGHRRLYRCSQLAATGRRNKVESGRDSAQMQQRPARGRLERLMDGLLKAAKGS